jgi:DNA-binding transcriptional MerR regulator
MSYALKAVCGYLGVPPDTVRKWEARYDGLVEAGRARNGYRRYSEADLRRLLAFQSERNRGVPGAQAARQAAADVRAAATRPELQAEALDAAASFDRGALERLYRSSVRAGVVEEAFTALWLPVMGELGARSHRNGGLWIAVEHFATGFLRERVLTGLAVAARPGPARLAVCAPAGDRHELGMLVASCALERAGVRCLYLGADLPLDALEAALARLAPRGLALTLTSARPRRELKASLLSLRRRFPKLKVFVCGRESLRHANLVRESGAYFVGTELERGTALIRTELGGAA